MCSLLNERHCFLHRDCAVLIVQKLFFLFFVFVSYILPEWPLLSPKEGVLNSLGVYFVGGSN